MYSPSLHGLMNTVKSTHHTIHHFGSVKYAELVDPMDENGPFVGYVGIWVFLVIAVQEMVIFWAFHTG